MEALACIGTFLITFFILASLILSNMYFEKFYSKFSLFVVEKNISPIEVELFGDKNITNNRDYIFLFDKFKSWNVNFSHYNHNFDKIVYVTDTGNKYHKPGSRYLKRSYKPVKLKELEEKFNPSLQ